MARERRGRPKVVIALYRGDNYLGMGTYEELSNITGLSLPTLRKAGTPTYYEERKDSPYEDVLFKVIVWLTLKNYIRW